jgi:uncharacterized membrane protein (UPF0127 family)
MNKRKIRLSHVFIIIAIIVVSVGLYYRAFPLSPKVIINGKVFTLDVAATALEKEKGLGYRDSMGETHGMVFPYDHKEQFQFWMKGMNFPLDFLWIEGNTIVDMTEHVPLMTGDSITTVKPAVPVDKIIEFNSGTVAKYHIKIGDTVKFRN